MNKAKPIWQCRERTVNFKSGALLMGILNVTPDSFSDGGRYADKEKAVEYATQMIEEGADIVDVGGESSRPGSLPVDTETEMSRVLPVIEQLKSKTDTLISVDTQKSVVAEAALEAGAHIINDISALESDRRMLEVARRHKAGLILMHKKGAPGDMQNDPQYENVTGEVSDYLKRRIDFLSENGIASDTIALDPGIGFGKTTEHNIELIAHIGRIRECGRPIVIGLSRKRFLGQLAGRAVNERLAASLGALAYCLLNGASVMRVHDVRESRDVRLVLNAFLLGEKAGC
ncbi:MAG: dihydropteroate synthase [Kiritimatiellia bacterium]|nr:dihydropteroate synthase [Kiritimatiellia bacterium]